MSWCVIVVVVTDDPAFLAAFAHWSLRGRLLVWQTKLLIVTRLKVSEVIHLLESFWTFSVMNAMVVNIQNTPGDIR